MIFLNFKQFFSSSLFSLYFLRKEFTIFELLILKLILFVYLPSNKILEGSNVTFFSIELRFLSWELSS